jgi:trehalose utilization protein
MPLDVPLDFRDDLARVASPIVAKYPGIVPQYPLYRYEVAPQQPEAHLPEVLATSEVAAFRDATLAGARLGLHRPVNVMQFSYVDGSGATLPSAATVFIFNGKVCIYFPEHGTYPFNFPNLTIYNLPQLQWAIRKVYPGAFDLKSLNDSPAAPVSADAQN